MSMKGIMVDVNYCTGCEACILACQQERGFDENQFGITVTQLGPFQITPGKKDYEFDFIPQFTNWCDLCEERTAKGKRPSCVQHCQAQCMTWGDITELAAAATSPKHVIYAIREEV